MGQKRKRWQEEEDTLAEELDPENDSIHRQNQSTRCQPATPRPAKKQCRVSTQLFTALIAAPIPQALASAPSTTSVLQNKTGESQGPRKRKRVEDWLEQVADSVVMESALPTSADTVGASARKSNDDSHRAQQQHVSAGNGEQDDDKIRDSEQHKWTMEGAAAQVPRSKGSANENIDCQRMPTPSISEATSPTTPLARPHSRDITQSEGSRERRILSGQDTGRLMGLSTSSSSLQFG